MNFGYPYNATANEGNYMGNVGTNMPNMGNINTMDYMYQPNTCGCGGQMQMPMQSNCNQVVQKCFVEEMPYYVGYNTHVVNNVVRRHIQIPVYTQTQETVYMDEWQTGCGCGCNR